MWHITTRGIICAILTYRIMHIYAWEIPAVIRTRSAGHHPEGYTKLHCDAKMMTPARFRLVCRIEKFLGPPKNNPYPHDLVQDIPLKAIIPILGCCIVDSSPEMMSSSRVSLSFELCRQVRTSLSTGLHFCRTSDRIFMYMSTEI